MSTNICEICGKQQEELTVDQAAATITDAGLAQLLRKLVKQCAGCGKFLCFRCWSKHTDQGFTDAH